MNDEREHSKTKHVNGLPPMTRTNMREWPIDRIAVVATLVVQLIIGGAFLLSWSDKIDLVSHTLSEMTLKVNQIQSDVAVLKVQVENVEQGLNIERRERERLEDRRRTQLEEFRKGGDPSGESQKVQ